MKKIIRISAIVLGGLAATAGFSATDASAASYTRTCTNDGYHQANGVYQGSGTVGLYSSSCYTNNTANQSSAVATAAAVLKTASTQAANLVGNRISNALNGGGGTMEVSANGFDASSGVSGGGLNGKAGVWVSGSWSDIEDENTATAFEGDVYTGLTGFDYMVTDRTVVGISAGYENVEIDTAYNGFGGNKGSLEGDGYTVAPYIGVRLSDAVTANLTGGYSALEYDTLRYDPLSGARITGTTDADRYFVNAALNGEHRFAANQNIRLRGTTGVFYATEEKDAYIETASDNTTTNVTGTDNDLGQLLMDARLGYTFRYVEPYALVGLEYDFTKDQGPVGVGQTQSMDEDFGAKFGGGLNLQLGSNVSGGIEAYTVEFRDDYTENTVTGGLRVQF